ncbi:non-ribosomal peptide synthetase [Streptomyces sp. NPDC057496]|uniref:non-ribosomal peptide synthetase n=1 Tax=Streptomyces sp. NPDC057496 TaxID=3346149 RepID=UPI003676A74B
MNDRPEHAFFESVDAAFRRQVTARPDKVAVWDRHGGVGFAELWDDAARLAAGLRAAGVGPGDAVGVYGTADRDSITAMLGVLLAGGHFVPAAPSYPVERVRRMMAISGAALLLATGEHRPPAGTGTGVRHVRELIADADGQDVRPEPPGGSPDDLAYVMFTSGSTGEPKAVGVPHGALTALCLRDSPIRRRSEDVFLVNTILTFDPSMLEIWSALLVGGSVLCAPSHALSLHETAELLRDPRVTTAVLTPAVFALMVEGHIDALRELRCLIVGGDVMPYGHVVRARRECPDLDLVNCYGPTENAIVSTVFALSSWEPDGGTVPIGSAVAGSTCHVLDEQLRPVEPGTVGDLYVGGDRLAAGYVGDAELTRERFVPDPFSPVPGARLYRTGDRVRSRPGGTLEFHGREDAEVKVRGFRVNLAEVEALVAADPAVHEVRVVPSGAGHERRITAFVRPADAGASPQDIRTRASERAPGHLVPDELVLVDAFPLTPAGKTDTRALLDLRRSAAVPDGSTEPDDKKRLAALWEARSGGSAFDGLDFFNAGGTSLNLLQLIDDIATTFAVRLAFEDVYGHRDFEELFALFGEERERQAR